MREAEPLCAENIGLKDIARSRRGELISRGELIMYYSDRAFLDCVVDQKVRAIIFEAILSSVRTQPKYSG